MKRTTVILALCCAFFIFAFTGCAEKEKDAPPTKVLISGFESYEGKVLLGKLFKKSKTIRHKQQVRERVRVRETSSDSFYDRKFIGRNV